MLVAWRGSSWIVRRVTHGLRRVRHRWCASSVASRDRLRRRCARGHESPSSGRRASARRHEHRRRTSTRRGRHAAMRRRIETGRWRHAWSEMMRAMLRCRRVSRTGHGRWRSERTRRERRRGRDRRRRHRAVGLLRLRRRRVHLLWRSCAAVTTKGLLLLSVRSGLRSAATVGLLRLLLLRCRIHPAISSRHRRRNCSGSEHLECGRSRT